MPKVGVLSSIGGSLDHIPRAGAYARLQSLGHGLEGDGREHTPNRVQRVVAAGGLQRERATELAADLFTPGVTERAAALQHRERRDGVLLYRTGSRALHAEGPTTTEK